MWNVTGEAMLDKELFYESKKEQFKDNARMILHECQYGYQNLLDITTFNQKMDELHKYALIEGITEEEWTEITNSVKQTKSVEVEHIVSAA